MTIKPESDNFLLQVQALKALNADLTPERDFIPGDIEGVLNDIGEALNQTDQIEAYNEFLDSLGILN